MHAKSTFFFHTLVSSCDWPCSVKTRSLGITSRRQQRTAESQRSSEIVIHLRKRSWCFVKGPFLYSTYQSGWRMRPHRESRLFFLLSSGFGALFKAGLTLHPQHKVKAEEYSQDFRRWSSHCFWRKCRFESLLTCIHGAIGLNKIKRESIFLSRWTDLISKESNGRDAFHIGMCVLWAGVKGIDCMVICSWLMLLNEPTSPGAATLICTFFTGFCTSR